MNIIVRTYSKTRKDFTKVCALYFVQYLNLKKSRYTLTINFVPRLYRETKVYGMTYRVANRHIVIDMDSRLPLETLIGTLAHEMIHVKQFALGQLRESKTVNGMTVWMWCGKPVKKKYFEQPWEIEAYTREEDLINEIMSMIAKDNVETV